ncbi:MAG: hypothetical protein PQ612_09035 [Rickettsiales bacterium]|nr:hypothetical protein [Pseudomonadota bacterium]MDG4544117.1 hypothetical protein [Rickettsiales bacterium]MDG4546298.1 hypothetical protein [Rickettsiales bacterium]MDG4548441.1 hypothetical protein [Rickettsiales bacterium]
MRNIFDQYTQPENRLTHALISILNKDGELLRRFLKDLVKVDSPPTKNLKLTEQSLPGQIQSIDEAESKGLPDAVIYDDQG